MQNASNHVCKKDGRLSPLRKKLLDQAGLFLCVAQTIFKNREDIVHMVLNTFLKC